jgi:uncharacterized membrane protein
MNKQLDKKYVSILICFLLFFVWVLLQEVKTVFEKPNVLLVGYSYRYILLTIVTIIPFTYVYLKKNKTKVSKLFLCIIIPMGIFYSTLFIPGSVPDEPVHYRNAFVMASMLTGHEDKITESEKNYSFKTSIGTEAREHVIKELSKRSDERYVDFDREANDTSQIIMYLPQIMGVIISRICGLNVILELYLVRIINFFVYVFLTYYAIRSASIGKEAVLLLSLVPMSVQQATSASYDALVISTCAYVAVNGVNFILGHMKLDMFNKVLLVICAINVLFIKGKVYSPLLLLFVIPLIIRAIRKIKMIK